MTMADTIAGKLKQALSPREIHVRDVSHQHAGHSGWREGGHISRLFCVLTALPA